MVLVTGGAGFIGANAVAWLLREHPQVQVVAYDAMTYAAHPQSLAMAARGAESRFFFVRGDVRDGDVFANVLRGTARDAQGRAIPMADTVWHMAAESHVDRSIRGPGVFVDTNVVGTQRVLDAIREAADAGRRVRYVHVSTDEVYGSLAPGDAPFTETHPLEPSSPYSASKAASDLLAQAWARSYGLDVVVTRCSNNYGPFQFPEKLIPLMVVRAMAQQPLPVYGDGQQVRDWLYVEDHVSALWAVTLSGIAGGQVFNIGARCELTNLDVVRAILRALDRPESLIQHVQDRPAHDRRYAMDSSALRLATGWEARVPFAHGLEATIRWYRAHAAWWKAVLPESQRMAEAMYLGGER
ncbi:MAG: dTDP-glucose 4,6-dehydratase [Gemmatimonas sp.]|nr:dTDP-glucose 4,6-dehydratase [Gemmatimonas sp.]